MTTDVHNPAHTASNPSTQEDTAKVQELVEGLSTEELSRPTVSISAKLGRSFAGRIDYPSELALNAAMEEAQRALPQVPSAYKATGKTTALATLVMVLSAPLVLIVLLGICGALCWGWVYLLSSFSSDSSYGQSRLAGLFSLGVDLALVVLMVVIPMASFGLLSKWFKNRNPLIPAILTGLVDLLVAIALFMPVWKGETLAPTHLTFLFIPIRWVLIVIGGLLVPFIGAVMVYGKVSEQKFCEETGCFLKRFGEIRIAFDLAENSLALLTRKEYLAAVRMPRLPEAESKQKHWAGISLWWREQAATAFLELNLRFHGKSQPEKKVTAQQAKDKTKEWLAFSVQLDRAQAEILGGEFRIR
jgi:hypothetical protein